MILLDANILLYAEDEQSPMHAPARASWDGQLSGSAPVGLCWTTLLAFLRISTNPRVFRVPLSGAEAADRAASWLDQPCVRVVGPSADHWAVLRHLLAAAQATASLVPDAHLAAIAIEHNCTLCSTDAGFARFPGLHWENPLA